MQTLQAEHKTWVDANFPQQLPELPAAGMVEEAGELLHALIAKYRIARWGADRRYTLDKLDADLRDAIGDCCIYAVSYCNAAGWPFHTLFKISEPRSTEKRPSHTASGVHLVHCAVQFFDLQEKVAMVTFLRCLRELSADCSYDFEQCVMETWNRVKERKR